MPRREYNLSTGEWETLPDNTAQQEQQPIPTEYGAGIMRGPIQPTEAERFVKGVSPEQPTVIQKAVEVAKQVEKERKQVPQKKEITGVSMADLIPRGQYEQEKQQKETWQDYLNKENEVRQKIGLLDKQAEAQQKKIKEEQDAVIKAKRDADDQKINDYVDQKARYDAMKNLPGGGFGMNKDDINIFVDQYVADNKNKIRADVDKIKEDNLNKYASSISNSQFEKMIGWNQIKQQLANYITPDNPADFLNNPQKYSDVYASKAADEIINPLSRVSHRIQSLFGKPDFDLKDIMNPDGSPTFEFKKKALEQNLDNPYKLYNTDKLPIKKDNVSNAASSLIQNKIVDHSNAESASAQFLNGVSNAINSNPYTRHTLGYINQIGQESVKTMVQLGAFGASLGMGILNGVISGVSLGKLGTEEASPLNLYGKYSQQIESAIPNKLPEDAGILDEVSRLIGMILGSAGLGEIAPALELVKPGTALAEGTAGIGQKLLTGLGRLAPESRFNNLAVKWADALESFPKSKIAAYGDNFVQMNFQLFPSLYAGKYNQYSQLYGDDKKAKERALADTQIEIGFLSALPAIFKSNPSKAMNMVNDALKTETKTSPFKFTLEGMRDWMKSGGVDKAAEFVGKLEKGSLEFGSYEATMEYRRQKEEFDTAKEKGLIPANVTFTPDFNKILESTSHGAIMGNIMGIYGEVVNNPQQPVNDIQARSIASIIENPKGFESDANVSLRKGIANQQQVQTLGEFRKALSGVYWNNKQLKINGEPITPEQNVKLSVAELRLADAQQELNNYRTLSQKGGEIDVRKLQQLQDIRDNAFDQVSKLKSGTFTETKPISSDEMKRMANKEYSPEQANKINDNAPFIPNKVSFEELSKMTKDNKDIQEYIDVLKNKDVTEEVKKEQAKEDERLRLLKAKEKYSTISEAETNEIKELTDRQAARNKYLDVIGFEPTVDLQPVVDKDGNVIDGHKRIAKALFEGKGLEIMRPITDADITKLSKDQYANIAGPDMVDKTGIEADSKQSQVLDNMQSAYEKVNDGGKDPFGGIVEASKKILDAGIDNDAEAKDLLERLGNKGYSKPIIESAWNKAKSEYVPEEVKPEEEIISERAIPKELSNVEETAKALTFESKTDEELNNIYNQFKDSKNRSVRGISGLAEKIQEERERNSILNTSLDKAESQINDILSKEEHFLYNKEAQEAKNIINKYLGKVTPEEAIKDFKDSFFGDAKNWIPDAIKMRESVRAYIENGGNFKDLLSSVQKEFSKEGYESDAADVINTKLKELTKPRDFSETRELISEYYHGVKEDGTDPEFVKSFEKLLTPTEYATKVEGATEMDVRKPSEYGGEMAEGNAKPEGATREGEPKVGEGKTEGEKVTEPKARERKMTAKEWLENQIEVEGLTPTKAMNKMLSDDIILDGIIKKLNSLQRETKIKYEKKC